MSAAPASGPGWRSPGWWGRLALTYAVALVGGTAAHAADVPLAWMLGAFFACGTLSALGAPLVAVPFGRELGQMMIGLGVGLRFTAATLVATLSLFPAMLAATAYVVLYTLAAAFLLRPAAAVNHPTAFFSTAAGGVADMAFLARDRGGDAAAVTIVHALRVSTTVAIVPIVVVLFGTPGTAPEAGLASGAGLWGLALALLAALGVVQLLRKTALPNPWLVGAMFVGIALGVSGVLSIVVPPVFLGVAQVLLGTWLGCRFRREVLVTLPRVAASGAGVALFMIGAAFLGALALAAATPLSVSTAFLALAPAAMAEMVITAKAMHLDAEVVTAFHVVRIFLVCTTALIVFRIYRRLAGAPPEPSA